MHRSIALLGLAFVCSGCFVTYHTDVKPTEGAPKLPAQASEASIVKGTERPRSTEGMRELAHLHVFVNENGSLEDCDHHLAKQAAELGATVAWIHDERVDGWPGSGKQCYGFALAPATP